MKIIRKTTTKTKKNNNNKNISPAPALRPAYTTFFFQRMQNNQYISFILFFHYLCSYFTYKQNCIKKNRKNNIE